MKVRYYGHAGQTTGYGRAAEGLCFALLAAGAELELRTLAPYDTLKFDGHNLPLASLLKHDADLDPHPDAVIVHTLPGDCHKVVPLAMQGPGGFTNTPALVAYTTWEVIGAPRAMLDTFEVFDEVWHPSEQSASGFDENRHALEKYQSRVIPHAFDEDSLPDRRKHAGEQHAGAYKFYYVGAWNARKNPAALLRAYAFAFDKNDDVELLLQCAGTPDERMIQAMHQTGMAERMAKLRFTGKACTDSELAMIHAGADCFVTATRGEAWNLPCFDAMLAGRHIIAPQGQGHQAYLHGTSASIYMTRPEPAAVDIHMAPDGQGSMRIQSIGAQGLTSKSLWLEPHVLALAEHMQVAFESRVRDLRVDYDPRERFGYKAVGALAMDALRTLCEKGTAP